MISATIIADSISPTGQRLTTMVLRYPRFILAELNTHRMLSRNSASSRAIPIEKMVAQIGNDPVMPVFWGSRQKGMQAGPELTGKALEDAKREWLEARDSAIKHADDLMKSGLSKELTNRILEPWTWTVSVVTATEWDNFYALRCHPDAQPEMKALAEAMLKAHNESLPRRLELGEWHLPFVDWDKEWNLNNLEDLKKYSVARCARVSYLNHDGSNPDIKKDLDLHDRLLASGHMSPFEHQATPLGHSQFSGNFKGWDQYRKRLIGENRVDSNLRK